MRAHKSLVNPFEPSKAAAAPDGPNTNMPDLASESARPSTKGAFGADNNQINGVVSAKGNDGIVVGCVERNTVGDFGESPDFPVR